jgi:hypothetical protein
MTTHPVAGAAVPGLVRTSGRAALLVMGTTGSGGLDEVLLGSTTLAVSGQARCPVVGVRRWPLAVPADAPVALGVSSAESDAASIEVGFERAHRLARRLLVVHACQEHRIVPRRGDAGPAQGAGLAEDLLAWHHR